MSSTTASTTASAPTVADLQKVIDRLTLENNKLRVSERNAIKAESTATDKLNSSQALIIKLMKVHVPKNVRRNRSPSAGPVRGRSRAKSVSADGKCDLKKCPDTNCLIKHTHPENDDVSVRLENYKSVPCFRFKQGKECDKSHCIFPHV
jgi:hypothetical protein